MKRLISFWFCVIFLLTLIPFTSLEVGASSSLDYLVAQAYYNALQDYEGEILKEDHAPFSDSKTGTVAYLDVTGDGVAELLFLTITEYYNTNTR